MRALLDSVEASSQRQWRTVLRDQGWLGGRRFAIQVGQNSLDDSRNFNA
jgi:hypothetical protein